MNVGFNCQDKNVANKLQFLSKRDLYEFSRWFAAQEATNRTAGAKIGNVYLIIGSFCWYCEMCGLL